MGLGCGYSGYVRPRLLVGGRVVLYILGFLGAAGLDAATPEGIADWLIELVLVWLASMAGTARELLAVAGVASVVIAAGLWSSPKTIVPFWMEALNRLVAIGVIWTMVHVAAGRWEAEDAAKKAAHEVKVLQGLLPICAACKAIRTSAGEWRRLETYLVEHSEAKLTHSLCPACAENFYRASP